MNKKQLAEKLKQNMPEFEGAEEEKELKKALYIYIELGKIKAFDENYFFGNSKTRKKIYRLAQSIKHRPDEIAKKRKIICVTLTHLYCSILKDLGINAIESEPDEDYHIYPIITKKNKNKYMADLQSDLENIQTGSRLIYFRPFNSEKEYQEKLTKYLIEMKYIKDEKDYKDEKINSICEKVKNMEPHELLKNVFEDKNLYSKNEEMGIIELYKFYKSVLRKTAPDFLDRKIYLFNCYKQEQEDKDYTLCAFSEEKKIQPYLFSKKEQKFINVDIPTFKKLQDEGLKLGVRPKENGTRKLQKYLDKYMEKREEEREDNR